MHLEKSGYILQIILLEKVYKQQFDHYKETLIVIKIIQMCNFVKYIISQKKHIKLPSKVGYNNATEKDEIKIIVLP